MGWFWCDTETAPAASCPVSRDASRGPPPGCPMHQKSASLPTPALKTPDASCPYTSGDGSKSTSIHRSGLTLSKLNPLNYMFSDISQDRTEGQSIILDTEREPSSIPKGSGDGNWEYPSPQQMYNALLRKGYYDTNPEHVTTMVSVHNFLNEGAWREIRVWEGLFSQGLMDGWKKCENGEAGIDESIAGSVEPRLIRFQGRPKDITPKATMVQVMGWIYPSKYKTNPPFDRHDWFVERKVGDRMREIRYVIDYYEGPDDPSGEPVFYLDVRPAIDSPALAMERMTRWVRDVWYRASGGLVREARESDKNK